MKNKGNDTEIRELNLEIIELSLIHGLAVWTRGKWFEASETKTKFKN